MTSLELLQSPYASRLGRAKSSPPLRLRGFASDLFDMGSCFA